MSPINPVPMRKIKKPFKIEITGVKAHVSREIRRQPHYVKDWIKLPKGILRLDASLGVAFIIDQYQTHYSLVYPDILYDELKGEGIIIDKFPFKKEEVEII